jgi:ADP-ribose pyrophosphatase YjhB (NUDIX family)
MNKNFLDKLAYIEIKNNKVLVSLSKGKDTWYIPGGKREGNETDGDALSREVKEELSVDLIPKSIKFYGVFEAQAHGKPEGIMVRMSCYTASYNGILKPNSEIEKLDFFSHQQKTFCAPVDNLIFDDLKQKGLIN